MGQRILCLTLRELESKVAMKKTKPENGQSIMLFAIMLPIMALFLIGIMDYMVTNARMMDTVAAADLAAHAGAQEVELLPDGTVTVGSRGSAVAAMYFNGQLPTGARLVSVACGRYQGRPACWVTAEVQSPGYLLPERWITVNAIGYLAHGVTEGDQ